LEIKLLPTEYDVDDAASLRRLREELLRNISLRDIAPHTGKFLRELVAQRRLNLL
jgi:hypothetical protein